MRNKKYYPAPVAGRLERVGWALRAGLERLASAASALADRLPGPVVSVETEYMVVQVDRRHAAGVWAWTEGGWACADPYGPEGPPMSAETTAEEYLAEADALDINDQADATLP